MSLSFAPAWKITIASVIAITHCSLSKATAKRNRARVRNQPRPLVISPGGRLQSMERPYRGGRSEPAVVPRQPVLLPPHPKQPHRTDQVNTSSDQEGNRTFHQTQFTVESVPNHEEATPLAKATCGRKRCVHYPVDTLLDYYIIPRVQA